MLFVNDSTGASDLVMDPNNPRILFAGFWQVQVHTWGRMSGGAGSGIWKSTDGGTTWTRLKGAGLPTRQVGKVGLAMTRANSDRIYALIETGDGVPAVNIAQPDSGRLFRSDDGGSSWQLVSYDRQIAGRTHYYNRMAADARQRERGVLPRGVLVEDDRRRAHDHRSARLPRCPAGTTTTSGSTRPTATG